jgi:hypothetical protein
VTTFVTLEIASVGFVLVMVKRVLVEDTVTRAGVTVVVGLTVVEGIVVVSGSSTVDEVSVVVTVL